MLFVSPEQLTTLATLANKISSYTHSCIQAQGNGSLKATFWGCESDGNCKEYIVYENGSSKQC